MRTHGTLTRWNDDRGFGFITTALGSDEVFVHISAFPRDDTRPRIGELISFEVETRSDRRQAVRVMRPGSHSGKRNARPVTNVRPRNGLPAALLALLVVGAMAMFGYSKLAPHHASTAASAPTPAPAPAAESAAAKAAASAARHAAARSPDASGDSAVDRSSASSATRADGTASAVPTFTCDSRTRCTQMTSCAEARFFLKQCPGARMDGNHDGEPCEQQWCH